MDTQNIDIHKFSVSVVKPIVIRILLHLVAQIFVQVEKDVPASLVALTEDVGLVDETDPSVVIVEPLASKMSLKSETTGPKKQQSQK